LSGCVIIFAQREDVHAQRLCSEVSNLGVKAFRIDAEDINQLRINFRNGHFAFERNGDTFHAHDVRSVFVRRRPNSRDFGYVENKPEVNIPEYIALQREVLFQDAFFSLQATARFYNSFDATTRFMGKLSQDLIARDVGFNVAETLVGSSDQEVVEFINKSRHRGARVCTKPLAQKSLNKNGQIFTRYTEVLSDNIDIEEEDFESCPLIFQEYIEKEYELRVTVADARVMAVRIDSQLAPGETKIDWRKYNIPKTPHSVYKLPDQLADQILKFHQLTGLRYSAFDFIRSADGRYVFLETNPSGQWLWLENMTGLPISREIALALCS
jgi:glutathione synthase/RimK-type ligase-like ATP-grasp enzyme